MKTFMNVYTVIAYLVRDGGHYVGTINAPTPTEAVVQIREKLGIDREHFEVVAVAQGEIKFECVDPKTVALAPYSAAQPD